MDRVTNIVWKTASSSNLASFSYLYNNASMIMQRLSVVNARQSLDGYGYDDLDRLTSETSASSATSAVAFSYDEVGNRLTKTNGSISVNYSYQNGCNRLTGWTATSTSNFTELCKVDVAGFSTETIGTNQWLGQLYVSNSVGTAVPSVKGANFTASSFQLATGSNQIVAAIGDQAGNVGYATNVVINQIVTNGAYLYADSGCITNIAYSGAGFSQNMGLTWNSQYQLTAVTTNSVLAEQNGFDALGRRVWTSDGSTTNYMVYDGVHVLAEVNSTGGLKRAYTHGPGIDNWLAMTVYTSGTAQTYFYISDHLGTVHAVTDGNGNIVESYRYDAWGRVLGVFDGSGNPLPQSALGNRILWQGREYSWATGLYFFRARWYDPISGRWLSNDPIGISGGLNQYIFCSDNPANFRDAFGLCGDGETEVSTEQRRIDRAGPFGYLVWFWDSLFVARMDYGYRSAYGGLPDSFRIGERTFESTPDHNQFSNYMIGRMAYYSGGNLGYLGARLGGHLGAASQRGTFDFRNIKLDDAGSIEMLRLGRQDAIQAEQEERALRNQRFQEEIRTSNPLGNTQQQINFIQRMSFGW
jgi:RHS repeat-associated protein